MDPVRAIEDLLHRFRHFSCPENDPNDPMGLGRWGEDQAARYLRSKGYRILRRNFRAPRGGEVDIVARHKPKAMLVFIEVKTRSSEHFGRPSEAVDLKKQRLITRGAMAWLRLLDFPDIPFRFDIVEVVGNSSPSITVIEDAFSLPEGSIY